MLRRFLIFIVFFIPVIALALGTAGTSAQTPTGSSQPQKVVERTVTTDAQGNTIVTERTFVGGKLVKEEIMVRSPQGVLIAKLEISYDPTSGQVVKREATVQTNAIPASIQETLGSLGISFPQGTPVKVEQKLQNGQTIELEVTFIQNGVKVEQEFKLINGKLTLVGEEREALHEEDDDDHSAGSVNQGSGSNRGSREDAKGKDRHEQEKREDNDHEEEDD
ncbi:MAG: hypothetical protein QN121_09040 [Armatimonadota bacterium]|nr:hypothetical protein [Armatimonadota bacterium]